MPDKPDDLQAVRLISEALAPFHPDEQGRIIRWVCERLAIPVPTAVATSSHGAESADAVPPSAWELRQAVDMRDAKQLKAYLRRFEKIDARDGVVAAAIPLASWGDEAGAESLMQILNDPSASQEYRKHILGGLAQYYIIRDAEKRGIEDIGPWLRREAESARDDQDRAFYLNQLGRLLYGAHDFKGALEYQDEAARLLPTEPAYFFNLSLIYQQLGDLHRAAELARRALDLGADDSDHLAHAVEVFGKVGDQKAAIRAFGNLRKADPKRAMMLARANPEWLEGMRHE